MQLTRRLTVFGAVGAAAAAASGTAFAAPAWVARHGMNSAQYQAAFDQFGAQGYRLVLVDGYALGGSANFAAIWRKVGGPAWVAHHNMTAAGFQQTFDQLGAQNYRLTRVSGYAPLGAPLYAAIWEQFPSPAWIARSGLSGAQYQQAFNQLTSQGYRATWVNGFAVGADVQYAAIFEKSDGRTWQARHGMTSADYQAAFDQAAAQGYVLRHVSGYSMGGAPAFAAIWDKTPSPPWQARHNLTAAQYQQAFDAMGAQGYVLDDVSGYEIGGQPLFAAIWVKS
jgi:hypothetical protein